MANIDLHTASLMVQHMSHILWKTALYVAPDISPDALSCTPQSRGRYMHVIMEVLEFYVQVALTLFQ
jgi:hypothetical protein